MLSLVSTRAVLAVVVAAAALLALATPIVAAQQEGGAAAAIISNPPPARPAVLDGPILTPTGKWMGIDEILELAFPQPKEDRRGNNNNPVSYYLLLGGGYTNDCISNCCAYPNNQGTPTGWGCGCPDLPPSC